MVIHQILMRGVFLQLSTHLLAPLGVSAVEEEELPAIWTKPREQTDNNGTKKKTEALRVIIRRLLLLVDVGVLDDVVWLMMWMMVCS
jgi:hypothetical protein